MLFYQKKRKRKKVFYFTKDLDNPISTTLPCNYSKPKRCANLEIVRNKEIMEQF